MEDNTTQIKADLEEVRTDVKAILYLLTGTEYDTTQGLLHRFEYEKLKSVTLLERMEKRVEKLEKWKDKVIWAGLGMALPAGYGIIDLLHVFFGKK